MSLAKDGFDHGSVKMDRKGQAYLLVSFILVVIMISIAFVSRTPVHQRTEGHFLMRNIEIELPLSYTSGIYNGDLNNIITEASNEFKDFAGSKGYHLRLVFAASNQWGVIKWYWLGNWWGENCTYYNSKRSPVSIPNGTTKFVLGALLLNDYNVIICGQPLDLTQDFDYRAELDREGEHIVSEG